MIEPHDSQVKQSRKKVAVFVGGRVLVGEKRERKKEKKSTGRKVGS